ncbi:MAG: hypothetical protein ACE5EC_07170 [Phycisphaerae bacterium]
MIVKEQSASATPLAPGDTIDPPDANQAARRVRLALAMRDQRDEIIKHREAMVLLLGRIVSLDEAARDWIPSHAAEWRARIPANPEDGHDPH